MPIDAELLRILICPRTHKPLRQATAEELAAVNARIEAGTARTYGGKAVSDRIEDGLIPEGEPVLYPIEEEIPVLLVDEAIGMNDAAPTASSS